MNRKQRRALEKKTGGKVAQNFSDKISQFQMLPEQCTTCTEPFDRQNREMLKAWSVVVKQEVVRLFCPHCMQRAKNILEKYGDKDESRETFVSSAEEDS